MSIRQYNLGSIVKPGFNPLGAQTVTTTYYPYLYGSGSNGQGQLGLGNITNYSSPKQVGSLSDWSSIACGQYSSFSIKTDGTLWAWGYNNNGQLGIGNRTDYSSPKQIGALTNWLNISCGQYHALALKTNGTLWSWGYNSSGQLGIGNTTSYSSPKQIGSLTTWSSISSGKEYSLALKTDGTLWSWGLNASGQLGLNNRTYYSSPKQIGALTTWSNISSGNRHCVVIKTDGTLWSWGDNTTYGQLGLANTVNYSSPKQVGSLTTWLTAAAGYTMTFAIKTDKTLWAWGWNNHGQLGLGNSGAGTYKSSPNQVGALTDWLRITGSGYTFSKAVKTDGTLWAWGFNSYGQLGDGTRTQRNSPVQIGALTTWLSVASGFYTSIETLY